MDDALNLTSAEEWGSAVTRPHSGTGTLARLGRVTLLVGSPDADAVAPLLGQAEMVAANGGQGRQLVRGFALLLGTTAQEPPPFAALAPHTTGLAVLVSGDAEVRVNGETISGRDSLAWVEKLVPWPITSVEAVVDTFAEEQPMLRLGDGVVSAGGFTVGQGTDAPSMMMSGDDAAEVMTGTSEMPAVEAEPAPEAPDAPPPPPAPEPPAPLAPPVPEPPAPEPPMPPPPPAPELPAPEPPAPEPPAPEPPAPPAPPAPEPPAPEAPVGLDKPVDRPQPPALEDKMGAFDSVLLHQDDIGMDDLEILEPLPIVEDVRDVTHHDHAHQVRGVFCKNRHFNDPRQLFCAVCGINMVQQTPVLVNGTRPPLGVIVLDDGAVFQLDSDYLLGRDPASDGRVQAGDVRGVPLQDQSNQISRVHARLELRGWDVVLIDNSSTNGTYVNPPKSAGWQRLPAGGEHVLTQGARVRIGDRTLAFNTHSGSATGR